MNTIKNNILIYALTIVFLLLGLTGSIVFAHPNESLNKVDNIGMVNFTLKNNSSVIVPKEQIDETFIPLINFKHGDVSWLPKLASQAGWPKNTHKRLADIILRESGGCPNRIGGSIVDKNCNIIGHTGATNKSDSGLLQINGVNWDPKRDGRQLLCADHNICTQEQLLDPLINLRSGYILYQKAGWDPWDPCAWGPKFAHRCKP